MSLSKAIDELPDEDISDAELDRMMKSLKDPAAEYQQFKEEEMRAENPKNELNDLIKSQANFTRSQSMKDPKV